MDFVLKKKVQWPETTVTMRIVRATLFVLSALTWASGSVGASVRSSLVRRAQTISSDEGEALEIPLFEATTIHTGKCDTIVSVFSLHGLFAATFL